MERDLWDAEHKCHRCNCVMEKTKFKIKEFDNIRGFECPKFGEGILHTLDAHIMLTINALHKRGSKVKVEELGNALVLKIPNEIKELYNIRKGKVFTIKLKDAKSIELIV